MDKRHQVDAIVAAVNRRDFGALADLLHPGIEFHSLVGVSEGEVYVGIDGLRRWAQNMDETWDGFLLEPTAFCEAGPDRAVVVFRLRGTARVSGVPLDYEVGQVWTWREGHPALNVAYSDLRAAYEAVGLGG